MCVGNFNEGKWLKIVGDFKNTCLSNWAVFRKTIAEKIVKIDRISEESRF
jgi:hypothetical protein